VQSSVFLTVFPTTEAVLLRESVFCFPAGMVPVSIGFGLSSRVWAWVPIGPYYFVFLC